MSHTREDRISMQSASIYYPSKHRFDEKGNACWYSVFVSGFKAESRQFLKLIT